MEISDVRVRLMQNATDRLRAVCSITLDNAFVIRDVKVVQGTTGLFVAMPSRKLTVGCPKCRHKNHLKAQFCNDCGAKLPLPRLGTDPQGRVRLHREIAHPIDPAFRERVQKRVMESFESECELAKSPDYEPVDAEAEMDESESGGEVSTESPGGVSEYEALIAGLRGGTEDDRAASAESRPTRRGQSDSPSQRKMGETARHPSGPRTDRSEPPRPQRGADQRSRGSRRDEPSLERGGGPQRSSERRDGVERPAKSNGPAPERSPSPRPLEPRRELPAAPQSAKPAVPNPPPNDDGEAPFGMGIL